MPTLNVQPEPGGGFTVGIWLLVGKNIAASYYLRVGSFTELENLLCEFQNDPEKLFLTRFGWKQPKRRIENFTLEDLGLA